MPAGNCRSSTLPLQPISRLPMRCWCLPFGCLLQSWHLLLTKQVLDAKANPFNFPDVALSFYTPGMRCRRSTDCQGAAVGFAECMRNICVCTNGAHSNGAHCVRPNFGLLRKARAGCDEFGSACRIHLIGALKQPMFAPEMRIPGIGNEQLNGIRTQHQQQIETPLWFNPVAKSFDSSQYNK